MRNLASVSRRLQIADIGVEAYERYTRLHAAGESGVAEGLRTGFSDLDRMIDVLEPGSLNVIAARTSMGKTSLALTIARNVASDQKKNVAIFSLEMSKQALMDRINSALLGVETGGSRKVISPRPNSASSANCSTD